MDAPMMTPAQEACDSACHMTMLEAAMYRQQKVDYVNEKAMPIGAKPLYDVVMAGLQKLQTEISCISDSEAKKNLQEIVMELYLHVKKVTYQDADAAFAEMELSVIGVCETISSKKGIMVNGVQPIGYVNARDFLGCETSPAPPTDAAILQASEWERTVYAEQLMRAFGEKADGDFKYHAVSPGSGMGFLCRMDATLQYYNALGNIYDVKQCSCGDKVTVNFLKSTCKMNTGMARIVAETLSLLEINEKPDDNDEFEAFLIFCASKGVKFLADDAEFADHPLYEFVDHPIIGPSIIGGKMSFPAISKAQLAMYEEFRKTGIVPAVPGEFVEMCALLSRNFPSVVVEGSETMMLRVGQGPLIAPDSLLINYTLKSVLARMLVDKWGVAAQLGGQSYRALQEDEEVFATMIPEGWSESRTKWGEAALPPACLTHVLGKSRTEACMVSKV